jgi:putative FmdB family regulatory protein
MPIYEYGCTQCGFELEKLQKLNDPPLTDCPACSKVALRKKVSAAGFRLKGSGWYETDFKKGSKRNLHDSGDGKPAGDSAKSSTKKEAVSTSTAPAKSD